MILLLVDAGDSHVCPYCNAHSGAQSPSLEDFESEWLQQNPSLSGWIRIGLPISAKLHPNCRCMLWRYEMSSCSDSQNIDWTCSSDAEWGSSS